MKKLLSNYLRCVLIVALPILLQSCGNNETSAAEKSERQVQPEKQAAIEASGAAEDTETSSPESSEEYRQITEDDGLYCGLRVAEVTYGFDSPLDGELVAFDCLNQADEEVRIELATTTIKDGEFTTVDFGVIRAEMAGSGFQGIVSI